MPMIIEETKSSLRRIQDFEVNLLVREDELGRELNFRDAVEPSRRMVELARRLPLEILSDLTEPHLNKIKNNCDNIYNIFDQCLKFTTKTSDPSNRRDELITQITNEYNSLFDALFQYIAYGVSQKTDFDRVDREARATLQGINDKASDLQQSLEGHEKEASRILEEVKAIAAEQGVTQQAIYFKEEADRHGREAVMWRNVTVGMAIGLGSYAILTLFIHKIPYLYPANSYETAQLIVSKILIFGVLAYMLFLSVRNFLSHTHNSIVNKHRKNSLLTFQALVDASSAEGTRDIVLGHASSCIFSPQETGYTRGSGSDSRASVSHPIVELVARTASRSDSSI